MIITCWSPKSGSGTSVTAVAMAAISARMGKPTVLIDLGGDAAAILGLPTPALGLGDVIEAHSSHTLRDVMVRAGEGLHLIASGFTDLPSPYSNRWGRIDQILGEIASEHLVLIDAGEFGLPEWLDSISDSTVVVIRPCYIALRRAAEHNRSDHLADAAIVVTERDRALTARDVSLVLGIPVVAEVPVHPDVSRRVDSGLLNSRVPDHLIDSLGPFVRGLI